MKKLLLIPFLLLIASISFGQTNLIKNGGFENEFQNWKKQKANGADASFTNDSRNKQDGVFSLKTTVLRPGANLWDISCFQMFPSQKDKIYRVTLSAKTRFSGKKIRLQMQNRTFATQDLTLSNQWENYAWEFIAKENNLVFSIQYIEAGTFFVDNVSIKEIRSKKGSTTAAKSFKSTKRPTTTSSRPIYSTNNTSTAAINNGIIQNGDFESGMSNWNNEQYNGGVAKFSLNTKSAYSGTNSYRVTTTKFGPNPWDVQSVKKINVRKGKSYKLTFYAKANGTNKKVKVQIQDNTNKAYLPKTFAITSKWQKFEWSFTAETNTMELSFQHISKGTMDFDNISFEPIAKLRNTQRAY